MKLADIKLGVLYAVSYGCGIEPALAFEFERSSLNGPTGVMMEFTRMRQDKVRWVGANRVIEPWTARAERVQAEKEADERWWQQMAHLSDTTLRLLTKLGLETHKVKIGKGKLTIQIEDPTDVQLLCWQLNS